MENSPLEKFLPFILLWFQVLSVEVHCSYQSTSDFFTQSLFCNVCSLAIPLLKSALASC